jgi:ribosome-binding protein aMBF1 (putative translation factor)
MPRESAELSCRAELCQRAAIYPSGSGDNRDAAGNILAAFLRCSHRVAGRSTVFRSMVTTDLKTLLGITIRNERSVLGISQEDLAERAGLHRNYVSDLERGARDPSISSIEKIAQALNLSVSVLFERTSAAALTRKRELAATRR